MPEEPMLPADIVGWLRNLSEPAKDPLLSEMTALAKERDFPIVGPEVGRLLSQMTRLIRATRVFEMGSGFGYSTLWLARAVTDQGRVYHTDGNPKNSELAQSYLKRAGLASRVVFLVGDARELLQATVGEFDVIFLDIDKVQYPSAYKVIRDRVRIGGVVIADNLIWSGRVARGEKDADSEGIREYIRLMWSDSAFLSCLLPVRDGVGVSMRLR